MILVALWIHLLRLGTRPRPRMKEENAADCRILE